LPVDDNELFLRRKIESYYLPSQLIQAITDIGEIPETSTESLVGIGFLDIADYTYLSKFLSAKENHIFLNGLYAAFNWVIKKHGGYLNKIEGDSIMFHYGGPIDPNLKDKNKDEAMKYIAKELFYNCIELQRVCHLFNMANESVFNTIDDKEAAEPVKAAYEIINSLRNNAELSIAMNALFQVRIRVGASIGSVIIGNFGPQGARQWDVIGVPVIDAKRMESSAPAGGLRISAEYYQTLKETGALEDYFRRFKREANIMNSDYKSIQFDDVFSFSSVQIKGKKVSHYDTYSVQVNPSLPEDTVKQLKFLLSKDVYGVDRIIEILQYYRGNHYVINRVEKLFKDMNIRLRKDQMLKLLQPDLYNRELRNKGKEESSVKGIDKKYSLYDLMKLLGKLQDALRFRNEEGRKNMFVSYESYIKDEEDKALSWFDNNKSPTFKTYYYYNVIYPMFFEHLKASMLEYQASLDEVEEL